jgi:hypothetical protein
MSGGVSGNEEQLTEWVVLLRAVATPLTAVEMLYKAADLLGPGGDLASHYETGYNAGVLHMVATLLGFPNTDPATIERVLRSLPDPT